MLAKNITKVRGIMDYSWPSMSYISGNPYSGVSGGRFIVTPNAMNPGNHKDPKNWGYDVVDDTYFSGQLIRQEGASHYQHTYIGCLEPSWGLEAPSWDRTPLYNRALEKLNAKVRGDLDLSIDLAEAGTTGRMIRGITEVVRFAKSGRWKSTKTLADGWLQWQYGWKPLFSDIYDACDDGQRVARKALTHVKASVKHPIWADYRSVTSVKSAPQHPMRVQGTGVQACTIAVWLEPRTGSWDIGQWSSLNPVSIGWELIPYSFVVDWFVDVGSWLRNLETAFLYGTIFKSGYVSELYAYDGKQFALNNSNGYVLGSGGPYPETWMKIVHAEASTRRRSFRRTVLTSYPFPRKPTFKVDLGSQRLFSAAALLRQLLK